MRGSPLNCRKVNNLLSAYIDGELAGVEQLQIRQHLRDCCECNYEHESLLLTKRMLSSLCVKDARPGLEERILDEIHGDPSHRPPRFDRRGWWSLFSERQRTNIRTGGLIAGLCAVTLVYVTIPAGRTGLAPDQVMDARADSPAYLAPQLPVADYYGLHNSYENSQPFGHWSPIIPAGDLRPVSRPMR